MKVTQKPYLLSRDTFDFLSMGTHYDTSTI